MGTSQSPVLRTHKYMSFDIEQINKDAGLSVKTINGKEYTVTLLPATIGLKMSLEISKLLAPSLGASVDGLRHDDILHGAPQTFSDLALKLVNQMDKVNIVGMIGTLLGSVEVNGKRIDFDNHFRANYGELIQVLEFALRENFESFFTGSGLQTRFQEVMENLTPQPQELEESLEQ